MEVNLITIGITALVTGTISGFVGRMFANYDKDEKNSKLTEQKKSLESDLSYSKQSIKSNENKIKELSQYKEKYMSLVEKIKASSVSESYYLPVFITGPRSVGKSSLVEQWNAPWNHSELPATREQKTAIVPISYFYGNTKKPHFLDSSIKTQVKMHLILKVHDFPGEISQQDNIIEEAKKDTDNLQETTGKNLGIVLICMLNSNEVIIGLQQDTINYFNGKFFQNLRDLQINKQVNIDKLILVFNKYDLLKEKYSNEEDKDLMRRCMDTFEPAIKDFRHICSNVDVYPVFTILSRENMLYKNQGASIVKGAASRRFVEVMAGSEAANKLVVPDVSAEQFWNW
jgi:GTPase SAR1 family protein